MFDTFFINKEWKQGWTQRRHNRLRSIIVVTITLRCQDNPAHLSSVVWSSLCSMTPISGGLQFNPHFPSCDSTQFDSLDFQVIQESRARKRLRNV